MDDVDMNDLPMSEPRLRSLLRQAQRVADSGKRAAAEQLYRDILTEMPETAEAWVGLGDVLLDSDEAEAAYMRALAIDPDHEGASAGLARLNGEAPPETAVAIDPPADDPFSQSRTWLDSATARPVEMRPSPPPAEMVETAVTAEADTLVCYRHPARETNLRCYSCNNPICSECAVLTPVGYRCPTCIREAEDVFFTSRPLDYVLAPLVTFPISLLAGFLAAQLSGGFFFILIILFAGGAVGNLIGRIAFRVVGRRRGRYLPHVVAATVVLGAIIPMIPILLVVLLGNVGGLLALLGPGIYAFVAASAAFYQLR